MSRIERPAGTSWKRLFSETGMMKRMGHKPISEYAYMKRPEFGARFYGKVYSKEHDVDNDDKM